MTDPVMLLSQAHGDGHVTFRALRAAGFYTLADIAEAQVQVLAERARLGTTAARRLKAGAEEMLATEIATDFPRHESPSTAARVRSTRRGANGRGADEAPAPVRFSEGVSLEEASLLGQEPEAPGPIGVPAAKKASPEARPAALRRVPGASAVAPAQPHGGGLRRSFWTFG